MRGQGLTWGIVGVILIAIGLTLVELGAESPQTDTKEKVTPQVSAEEDKNPPHYDEQACSEYLGTYLEAVDDCKRTDNAEACLVTEVYEKHCSRGRP